MSLYDKFVDVGEANPAVDDFVTFVAEILNGGVSQLISNQQRRTINSSLTLLKQLAETGKAPSCGRLHQKILMTVTSGRRDYEGLESWMYKDANMEPVYQEVISAFPAAAPPAQTTPEAVVESLLNG